jgi:acetylornithine/N-succinyldiaminopimelate aminotransferase
MKTAETIALYEKYVIGNYGRLPVVIVRGEGSRIWDADGKEYLDLFPGWGVNGIGHCHPKVAEAVRRQVGRLMHIPNNFYSEEQGLLAKAISERSFGGKCFFCNSGAEAVEAAIKLARKATPAGKYKIVTMHNSFHGRTLAAITATAQPKYHAGFEPMPAGFKYVPYSDIDALEKAIDDETAGVMFELIQGEGGINISTPEFVKAARELCDKKGLVLIFDEVQTCMGRTGKWFGHLNYGVAPDIMTMAKALGGGMAIGGIEASPKIAAALTPGSHASTFGGNSLAAAAALATFEAIDEEKLLDNTVKMGKQFRKALDGFAVKYPFVKEVRSKGLMLGMELTIPGAAIVAKCLERGLNINCTHDTVLRMLPAMNITKAEADKGMAILGGVLAEVG